MRLWNSAKNKGGGTLRWIMGALPSRIRMKIYLFSCLSAVLSVFSYVFALFYKLLVDSVVDNKDSIIGFISLFVLVLFIQTLLYAIVRRMNEKLIIKIESILREQLFDDLLYKRYQSVITVHSGEWMSKITSDISVVSGNLLRLSSGILSIFTQILVATVLLYKLNPGFIRLLVLVAIAILVIEIFFYQGIKNLHKCVQEKESSLRSFILERINGLVIIRSYEKQEIEKQELRANVSAYNEARLKRNLFATLLNIMFGIGINGSLVLAAAYCTYGLIDRGMTYGTFITTIQIVSNIRTPLTNAYSVIPNYYSMIGSAERLKESNEYADERVGLNEKNVPDNRFFSLLFDNIFFSYRKGGAPIINGVGFQIRNGDFLAITGPSGCGKSTLLKLLLSLYEPSSGEIRIQTPSGTHRLSSIDRMYFAYVPQKNTLLKGTIKEAICFGSEYSEDRMNKALSVSCCEEFISQIDEGTEYKIGEKGVGLSEGQLQRIAIARAIYSEKPVLLLDEATGALNEELEIRILENLKELNDRTVVLVTHHKKTLSFFDQILKCKPEESIYRWKLIEKKN